MTHTYRTAMLAILPIPTIRQARSTSSLPLMVALLGPKASAALAGRSRADIEPSSVGGRGGAAGSGAVGGTVGAADTTGAAESQRARRKEVPHVTLHQSRSAPAYLVPGL